MIKNVFRGAGAIALTCLVGAGPVAAATVVVTPDTLSAAFAAAQDGDTLQLVGTFAGARLGNRSFAKVVTLNASQATFTNMLQLTNVSGVLVSGGRFDLTGTPQWTKGLLVSGGKNIYADRLTVIGSGTQWGASFVGTLNAQITNGSFSGLSAAVLFGGVSGGFIAKNKVTGATSDGIDISDSHKVNATYNSCSASAPAVGAHPDCIQLWSVAGHALQSDIIVTANTATGSTQGFTSFQNGGGGQRLQFTNNTVQTSDPQGVACYDCLDSRITGNHVSTLAGSTWQTVINVLGGSNNTVADNIVDPYRPVVASTSEALGAEGDSASEAPETMVGAFSRQLCVHCAGNDAYSETTVDAFTRLITDTAVAPAAAAGAVPEPATWSLLIAGFAAVGAASRRVAGRERRAMA